MSISDLEWHIKDLKGKLQTMDSITFIRFRDLVENKLQAQDTNIKNIIALLNKKYPDEIEYLSYDA